MVNNHPAALSAVGCRKVPSCMDPLLFTMYTSPLATLLRERGVHFHFYGNDSQIFLGFCVSDTPSVPEVICRPEACVAAVRRWMRANMLQLNADKTEFLIILTKTVAPFSSPVTVGEAVIEPSECARNLGVTFDRVMSLRQQVASLCRSAYYQLHCIGRIRRHLDVENAKNLVHVLVLSRLDKRSSLLYGLPKVLLGKLQRVQNAWARIPG